MALGLRAARREVVASRPMLMAHVTAHVAAVERPSRSFRRVRLVGPDLAAYTDPRPADAFRLVLGRGPGAVSRALTVSSAGRGELTLDVLDHAGGLLAPWLGAAVPGDEVGLLGVRTEFVAVDGVTRHLLVADGAGLPAVVAVLATLPPDVPATVLVRAPHPDDHALLPVRAVDDVRRVEGPFVDAVDGLATLGRGTDVVQGFVAAEGAEVRALRRDLVERGVVDRDLLRATAYWWAGSTGEEFDEVARTAWERARDRGLDVDDPIVVDEVLAEGARS